MGLFENLPDPGWPFVGNVQSALHRLQNHREFILYGPRFGHRFPETYSKSRKTVACLLCHEEFELKTDSRIPCPDTACPKNKTNEAEKAQRTVDEAYEISKDASELAVEAGILLRAALLVQKARQDRGKELGFRQLTPELSGDIDE